VTRVPWEFIVEQGVIIGKWWLILTASGLLRFEIMRNMGTKVRTHVKGWNYVEC